MEGEEEEGDIIVLVLHLLFIGILQRDGTSCTGMRAFPKGCFLLALSTYCRSSDRQVTAESQVTMAMAEDVCRLLLSVEVEEEGEEEEGRVGMMRTLVMQMEVRSLSFG